MALGTPALSSSGGGSSTIADLIGITSLGQKTMANSLPVVLPSDQTVPISVASLPLPSGAATSAKQDTQQTALDAIKTAIEILDNVVSGGEAQVDIVGALPAGTNNIGDVDIASIAAGDNNIGNVDIVTVPTDPFGANADAAATAGSTGSVQAKLRLMTSQLDSIKTAVETLDNAISGSEMQVDVVGALPAGTNAIGKLAANSGVDIGDVDVTSISAGSNNIGNVGIIPRTSGGMSIFRSLDIDETEEEVKATAGQLFSIIAMNRTAAPLYLKFYNATAANVTVGSTAPVLTIPVPANADSDVAGFVWNNEIGFAFSTAITVACTTGVADNDTGAPGANDCVINLGYA